MRGAAGFASIDAMVGLLVLSITLALGMNTVAAARRAADLAQQSRVATIILDSAVSQAGAAASSVLVESTELEVPRAVGAPLCRITARFQGRSGRSWTVRTVRPCETREAASHE